MIPMVKLRLKVGPKGQIVLPKIVRDGLGIKLRSNVLADLRENELVIQKGINLEELIEWLKATRKPVADNVSKLGLESETIEALP